ncbi:TPA: hypothetical protein ACL7JF_000861 [Streptococcus pneumoniae]
MIGNVVSIDSQPKMITTAKGDIKANSPSNVLMSFKADDQLSIYLKHNDFSQEHELLKDIKIGNTLFKKGELPSNFDSVVKVYFESVLGVAFSNKRCLMAWRLSFQKDHTIQSLSIWKRLLKNGMVVNELTECFRFTWGLKISL